MTLLKKIQMEKYHI